MDSRILRYDQLLEVLHIDSIRELEDLIIDAIYLDIIQGKLDQKEQQFEIEYTMGRDLEPGKVESLLAALQHWASTTSAVLATLDEKLSRLSTQTTADKAAKEAYEALYQQNLREVQDKQKEVKLVPRPREKEREREREKERERERERDGMDVDDPADPKGKGRK
ncbi:hypothetical protein EW026_g5303 [Hermanssonia centrifuga]|uniref:PCI domain-containing protein n=1 Tax=Hermanssonia centrifuga TaxID=98765 RepID=A0A4S4KG96_9APHY|nr:hypothetical protein EW026_g5303 [Hermanssonia centrifuga]